MCDKRNRAADAKKNAAYYGLDDKVYFTGKTAFMQKTLSLHFIV